MNSRPIPPNRPTSTSQNGKGDDASRKNVRGKRPITSAQLSSAASKLEQMIGQKGQQQQGNKQEQQANAQTKPTNESASDIPVSLGESILNSMMISQANTQGGQVASKPDVTQADNVSEIVGQIAEKILVSEPASGDREVRIVLKESVLPGTEIRISENGGKLQIQFLTDAASSHSMLQSNQESLQSRLQDVTGKNVTVSVGSESDMSDGDRPRDEQSRGYQQYLADDEQE